MLTRSSYNVFFQAPILFIRPVEGSGGPRVIAEGAVMHGVDFAAESGVWGRRWGFRDVVWRGRWRPRGLRFSAARAKGGARPALQGIKCAFPTSNAVAGSADRGVTAKLTRRRRRMRSTTERGLDIEHPFELRSSRNRTGVHGTSAR